MSRMAMTRESVRVTGRLVILAITRLHLADAVRVRARERRLRVPRYALTLLASQGDMSAAARRLVRRD